MSGPTSQTSQYSSVPSEIIEEQNSSFEPPNNLGPNEQVQVESNQTSQIGSESHVRTSEATGPVPGTSRSSHVIAEIHTSSDRVRQSSSSGDEVFIDAGQSLESDTRTIINQSLESDTTPIIDNSLQSDTTPVINQSLQNNIRPTINQSLESDTRTIMNQSLGTDLGLITAGQPLVGDLQPSTSNQSGDNTRHLSNLSGSSHQSLQGVDTLQTGAQSTHRLGPVTQEELSVAGPSQTIRSSTAGHWDFPNRKRSASSHIAPIAQDPILTVTFDNSPSISTEPLHRGNQPRNAPTVLANRSIRAAKSARSKITKR